MFGRHKNSSMKHNVHSTFLLHQYFENKNKNVLETVMNKLPNEQQISIKPTSKW